MSQRNGSKLAACLVAITCTAAIELAALADELTAPPANPAAERSVMQDLRQGETQSALQAGEELYKRGEYSLARERLQAAVANDAKDPEALLFLGLAELRLDDPGKAAEAWGKLQETAKDPRLSQEVGRMRTILLREASERAAREALAQERRRLGQSTDPRTVAVATFRNVGSPQYAPLGKALAAMLIDNLSALPGITVLEREQVEALEEEAKLSESVLVEKGTAVRVGKLLRAGRVSAGSHADWTASPTHLKLDALLVDVDGGSTLTAAQSQADAEEFFRLVPSVAAMFAAALNQPVSSLPPQAKQKIEQEHTHSLPATLAFGKALDGLDHHDVQAALEACKEVEKTDPNFKLAKKKCAFVPVTWLSAQGVAATMESTAFAMAGAETTSSYLVPGIVGALVIGGIAGGTYAAVHNGGGGGGGAGGGATSGNNPPQINGVSDRTVGAGQTASIDMTCNDPDGTSTTLANPNPPPGSTFSQTSGNPATGRYRQQTNSGEVGQTFTAHFTCTDSGTPPAGTSADATIRVVQAPQPTPTTPAPTPTPRQCQGLGTGCKSGSQCCSNNCDTELLTCCVALQRSCTTPRDCCTATAGSADCQGGLCCLPDGTPCSGNANSIVSDPTCCAGTCGFGLCGNPG
jgi:TolB-like protein